MIEYTDEQHDSLIRGHRKQLADAQATVEALQKKYDDLLGKYHQLVDFYDKDSKRLAAWRDEVIALRDERDRLRKALRPFAEVGDALDTREFINLYERWGTSGKRHVISMQHLKHAAAVYGATK